MYGFFLFPFYILIPFLLFSLLFRIFRRINARSLEDRGEHYRIPGITRRGQDQQRYR
jgi:hypothetical protein